MVTPLVKRAVVFYNHLCRVDSSTSILWTSPFPIERVSGQFLLLPCFTEISVFNAPFIYLAFEKRTHSYTWSSEILTYMYSCIAFWFAYTYTNKNKNCISQIKRYLSIILYTGRCLHCLTQLSNPVACIPCGLISQYHLDESILWNVGPSIYQTRKIGPVIYIFVEKREL